MSISSKILMSNHFMLLLLMLFLSRLFNFIICERNRSFLLMLRNENKMNYDIHVNRYNVENFVNLSKSNMKNDLWIVVRKLLRICFIFFSFEFIETCLFFIVMKFRIFIWLFSTINSNSTIFFRVFLKIFLILTKIFCDNFFDS